MGIQEEMNYVELPRPRKPSEVEIEEIQNKCNEVIRNNLEVNVEIPDDAKSHKLPGDYDIQKGVVRVIKIGNLDSNRYIPLIQTLVVLQLRLL